MTNLDSKSKKTINLVWFGILFSVFYWCLESVRDVIVFDRGNIFNRIFTPDHISFWMRILVFVYLFFLVQLPNRIESALNQRNIRYLVQ